MKKLLERIDHQKFYGWCNGAGKLHYRLIVTKDDQGKNLCEECARAMILYKDYSYAENSNSPRLSPPQPKKTQKEALRRKILALLGEDGGKAYTNLDLYPLIKDLTSSQQRLDLLLWEMRRNCDIVGRRLPSRGRLIYTLPDRVYLIKQKLRLNHEEHLLRLLDKEELTVNELAARLNRTRSTVSSWVDILKSTGAIATEVRKIPGKRGSYKFCRRVVRAMDESTRKLVNDLEARTDKTGLPLYVTVVERARAGYYHDYKSPIAIPATALINDLVALSFYDLAQKARNGEYDATEEESNAWMQSEGLSDGSDV